MPYGFGSADHKREGGDGEGGRRGWGKTGGAEEEVGVD